MTCGTPFHQLLEEVKTSSGIQGDATDVLREADSPFVAHSKMAQIMDDLLVASTKKTLQAHERKVIKDRLQAFVSRRWNQDAIFAVGDWARAFDIPEARAMACTVLKLIDSETAQIEIADQAIQSKEPALVQDCIDYLIEKDNSFALGRLLKMGRWEKPGMMDAKLHAWIKMRSPTSMEQLADWICDGHAISVEQLDRAVQVMQDKSEEGVAHLERMCFSTVEEVGLRAGRALIDLMEKQPIIKSFCNETYDMLIDLALESDEMGNEAIAQVALFELLAYESGHPDAEQEIGGAIGDPGALPGYIDSMVNLADRLNAPKMKAALAARQAPPWVDPWA